MKLVGRIGSILTSCSRPPFASRARSPTSPSMRYASFTLSLPSSLPNASATASSTRPSTRPILISLLSIFTMYFASNFPSPRRSSDFTSSFLSAVDRFPWAPVIFSKVDATSRMVRTSSFPSKRVASLLLPMNSATDSLRSPCLR